MAIIYHHYQKNERLYLRDKKLLWAGMHGSFHGTIAMAQGGKFIHGFAAGALGSSAGSYVPEQLQVVSAAAIGGTAASISGGKFANGAPDSHLGGAYVVLCARLEDTCHCLIMVTRKLDIHYYARYLEKSAYRPNNLLKSLRKSDKKLLGYTKMP